MIHRVRSVILLSVFIVSFIVVTACSSPRANEQLSITVDSIMTIAHTELYPVIGKQGYLSLSLVKGNYSEDWSPGPYTGRSWSGDFQLILSDESGNAVHYIDMNDFYSEKLIFNDFFEFQFDDYNGDGNIDFTIGQYGSSNGNVYKMFTLTEASEIQEVLIDENNEIFVSGGNRYSIKLDKVDSGSFLVSQYNNVTGEYIEVSYTWDGEKFNKMR